MENSQWCVFQCGIIIGLPDISVLMKSHCTAKLILMLAILSCVNVAVLLTYGSVYTTAVVLSG